MAIARYQWIIVTSLAALVGCGTEGTSPGDPSMVTVVPVLTNTGIGVNPNSPAADPDITYFTTTQDPNSPTVPLGVSLSPLLSSIRCMDVPSASSMNGTPVQLWDCNGAAAAQTWTWINGTLSIQGGTKCLVINSNDVLTATTVALTDCSAVATWPQAGQWNYQNGLIQAGSTNICIQIGDAVAMRGTALTLASCSVNDPRQRWAIDNMNGHYLRGGVVSVGLNSAKCIDISGGRSADGTQVQIYDCNELSSQQWVLEGLNMSGVGKCLTVSTVTPTLLEIDTCVPNSPAQQWEVMSGQIIQVSTGLCVSLPDSNVTNDTRLGVAPCSGSANQQWVWGG